MRRPKRRVRAKRMIVGKPRHGRREFFGALRRNPEPGARFVKQGSRLAFDARTIGRLIAIASTFWKGAPS